MSDDPANGLAGRIFETSLGYLLKEITAITSGKVKPKGKHDAASRVAWLAKQAASVAAEQRKAEAGELAALRKLSHATVVLWAKQQPAEARARLVREVQALDSKERRSVLG